MDLQMATLRTAKISETIGSALPKLLNNYTPSPVPDRYLVLERVPGSGFLRAWECSSLGKAASIINGNDDRDSRFQVLDLDAEGTDDLLLPILAVTDIIGEKTRWRLGEANAGDGRLEDVHATFLSLARLLANPKADIRLTLTEASGGVVDLRLDVSRGDMGAIVGKEGRTARALRGLLFNIGSRLNKKLSLDIREATT